MNLCENVITCRNKNRVRSTAFESQICNTSSGFSWHHRCVAITSTAPALSNGERGSTPEIFDRY